MAVDGWVIEESDPAQVIPVFFSIHLTVLIVKQLQVLGNFPKYTPQKKKLLVFSFANFEITRWSTDRQYVSFLNLTTLTKKSCSPIFSKFKLNKRGVNFFGECN